MTEIAFDCPHCGQSLEADDDASGSELPCPGCATRVRVPSPSATRVNSRARLGGLQATPSNVVALSCKNCGGQLDYSGDDVATCLFCGSTNVFRQPASAVQRLRDLESGSLSVTYFQPTIAVNEAPDHIVSAIQHEPSGFKNPNSLQMNSEGMYFPAWRIDAVVQCAWRGEYSEQRTVTKWRKVTKGSGNHSYQVDEPYNDTETIWHPQSGSHTFSTTLFTPAVSGFSQHQFNAALAGLGAVGDRRGHPASTSHFSVARPGKSQRQAWDEFQCSSRIEAEAYGECRPCIERLKSVSTVVTSKEFAMLYLPVAVVNYTANESQYRHFVNLRTGKFSGDIPLDHNSIAQEAKKAGTEQKKLERNRWFVATGGLPALALLGTLLWCEVNPFHNGAWIAWVIAAICATGFWRPGDAPWASFLWSRRAYPSGAWCHEGGNPRRAGLEKC